MAISETVHTLACPSCGGSIEIVPGLTTIICAWCGSTVVVPANGTSPRPFASEQTPLAARVEKLVRDGHDGRAVQLLRDELSLSLQAAGRVVELLRMTECKDVARVIQDAQEGKLK